MTNTDRNECIQVTLRLEDWATVVTALSCSQAPVEDKYRINGTIFDSARATTRLLS